MIFFTSDQHFGHKNVITYCNRPFKDVEEMNESLIARHNEVVQKNDTVWHLGDFSLSKTLTAQILPRLNGEHCLVAGNHDAVHPINCRSDEKKHRLIREYEAMGFSAVVTTKVWFAELTAWLCHLPYTNHDERFLDLLPKDDGSWLLHGHVHNAWKVKGRQINVGVDVWDYRPVSIDQLMQEKVKK